MKRNGMEVLGEDLRRRRLSAEDVQAAVDRAWGGLASQSKSVADEVLRDLKPFPRPSAIPSRSIRLVAAAAVLAAGLLLSLWPRGPHALLENGGRVVFGDVFRAPDGAALTLPDGSRVEIRSAAELALESTDDGTRIRLNTGSILVRAAKQINRHLYVQTRDLMVSVLGTVFLVETEEAGSRVVVIEGRVLAEQAGTAKVLVAGEQVSTTPARAVTQGQAAPAPAAVGPPRFELVSIRPSDVTHTSSMSDAKNERVTIENMNLRQIIRYAYDVEDYQISGPGMLTTDRYHINAKAPPGTPNSGLYPMLQSMLVDRFKMVLKREMRNTPVYALRQTNDGIKIKELAAGEQTSGVGQADPGGVGLVPGMRTSTSTGTMKGLADSLSRRTDRPVVDRTGLTGRYTIALQYVPESALRDGMVGPSLDMALEQLGLKLDQIRVPIEFLEIEHIEKPSPN
jgi:uncharacterized protein (TIGR03435 family)